MKLSASLMLAGALLLGSSALALGDNVRTDYDHGVDFTQYHTYSWGKVQTSDPFFVSRIKDAVDQQLKAKGWQLVPSGGSATVFASDNIHSHKEVQTFYDGLGGGWGRGWGWDGWGWRGGWWGGPAMGESTSTTTNQSIGNLVIDIFDGSSRKLLWRGLASEDLSSNANKNTKSLDGDIDKMFKSFPPKSS
jgi:Domain of unknown function (DUF4136)